jgi:hypothetical protein
VKPYITMRTLGEKLDFRGPNKTISALKWVKRRSIPKKWRGNGWVVAADDVEASLSGRSFVRSGLRAAS